MSVGSYSIFVGINRNEWRVRRPAYLEVIKGAGLNNSGVKTALPKPMAYLHHIAGTRFCDGHHFVT